jgi:hypothetical protein
MSGSGADFLVERMGEVLPEVPEVALLGVLAMLSSKGELGGEALT